MVDDARLRDCKDVIPRTSAVEMARIYRENSAAIMEHLAAIGELVDQLKATFPHSYNFDLRMCIGHRSHAFEFSDSEGAATYRRAIKRGAWEALIAKLNIERMMPTGKREALRKTLSGDSGAETSIDDFPDVTEESIYQVLSGYASSVDEFVEESIREEWEYFRVAWERGNGALATNSEKWKVSRKVIRSGVRFGYGGSFDLDYHAQPHYMALDQIMHLLDGKGPFESHFGPLVSAIRETDYASGATGETEYFRFKLFRNGNIHLEFKREDLLNIFNAVAAGMSAAEARQLPNPVNRRQSFNGASGGGCASGKQASGAASGGSARAQSKPQQKTEQEQSAAVDRILAMYSE